MLEPWLGYVAVFCIGWIVGHVMGRADGWNARSKALDGPRVRRVPEVHERGSRWAE